MINNKKILYAGNCSWGDPEEQHILLEMLSGSNQVIWANPYGSITGSLLPRISTTKEGLTIYNPGVNFLPVPFLNEFNERRRLLQIKLYLVEKDFFPDLVWFDDPLASIFADYYKSKGALTLYYAVKEEFSSLQGNERKKLAGTVDFIFTCENKIFEQYNAYGKAYFLEGGDLLPPVDDNTDEMVADSFEIEYLDALNNRLEYISKVVREKLEFRSR